MVGSGELVKPREKKHQGKQYLSRQQGVRLRRCAGERQGQKADHEDQEAQIKQAARKWQLQCILVQGDGEEGG